MRKLALVLLALALVAPAAGGATLMRGIGDGTLSVEDGNGRIVIIAKGGVIGRFDRGSVTVHDKTPTDSFDAKVWGATRFATVGESGERYVGTDVRFRLIGGEFRIVISGSGIDVSAVGGGRVFLEGTGRPPDPGKWFTLGEGATERERNSSSRRQP
jgi:hypothetical protein